RFVDSGILCYTPCSQCGGKFITHAGELAHGYQCVICHPPSRAIKKYAVTSLDHDTNTTRLNYPSKKFGTTYCKVGNSSPELHNIF
ncbi:hypothetical protein AA464_26295, partial [Salmonella enterica subsp. enterica serovar Newport]|nr:hypothetical protein [Salmonella enterica subsp. enterica serovar Newport]